MGGERLELVVEDGTHLEKARRVLDPLAGGEVAVEETGHVARDAGERDGPGERNPATTGDPR